MPAAPLPPRMYVVIGKDGHQYPVTFEKLCELIIDRRVTPAHMVYSYSSNQWLHAGKLPELIHLFPQASTRALSSKSRLVRVTISAAGLFVLVVFVTAALRCDGSKSEATQSSDSNSVSSNAEQRNIARIEAAVKRLSAGTPDDTEVPDCQVVTVASLSQSVRDRCRHALAVYAKNSVTIDDVQTSRRALAEAVAFGLTQKEARPINQLIDTTVARAVKAARARQRDEDAKRLRSAASARKAYGDLLRNRFLDQGMDIKVLVTGDHSDRIALRWALFNDVWTHRMQKPEGLIPEMNALGFKRVDVTDGYDYHMYWTMHH
jgi:hypothetical protein